MNCPAGSFASSPTVRSPLEDQAMMDTSPTHSSPGHAVPLFECEFQSFTGLGISHIQTEASADHLRLYPSPEPYVLSTSDWSDPILRSQHLLETPPDAANFAPNTYYEPFGSRTDVSASPLSFYSSQALSASPSYDPMLDFGAMREEVSHFWPSPPPETMAMTEGQTEVKGEPEDMWDTSLPDNASNMVMCTMPQVPQLQISTAFAPPPQSNDKGNDTLTATGASQGDAPDVVPAEVISKWIDDVGKSPNAETPKIPSASGLVCTVCGLRFTRRSNCREHVKRHNPRYRRTYPCAICGQVCGRKTDLKRHVDCIHYRVRNFGCDQCGQLYTRQDTLSRHKADGCRRRSRKPHASRKA
ncbi:C2H2 finger domain protein Ezf [Aspergillus heteromorphus CBS 117.55]|uniref:C2H2 finger domain protein Ezf n=1 Tax=Aspergillus heteromorphus CBS 117.55 TaxID=1448321 RepID=A0A317WX86_9EURO|nr:C2H2 finger domain protein Ezf [Aspergillus heteromorphus CBS 117.55]PWY89817.1 C2H2 finger domain protein Ezf [Aspergillus heteromorphus CBS 117.55]